MTTLKSWYIFSIAALSAASACWAGISQELSPEVILPGQRTTFTIRLDQKDLTGIDLSDEANVPELQEEPLNKADGILLLDRNYERTKDQFVWKYAFTAYLPQTYRLPPIEIRFGPQTFSTTTQPIVVHAARPDGDEELRPEFGEETIPTEISWNWVWFLLGTALLAAAWFGWKKFQRRPKPAGEAVGYETPEAWLKAALAQLLAEVSQVGSVAAVEKFSAVLRQYLRMRYLAPTHAMTLRELTHAVRQWESFDDEGQIQRLLAQIEGVLFRADQPANDFPHKAVETAEKTWLDSPPKETP